MTTRRWTHLLATLVMLVTMTFSGCSNPCSEIADLACQKGGEASPECKKTRESAANSSADEKSTCETVLSLVQSVNKK